MKQLPKQPMKLPASLQLAVCLLLPAAQLKADWQLNLTPGVTPVSADIFDLHMLVIWICTAIGVVVYGMLAWILVRHRRSRHPVAAEFKDNRLVEIIWTAIPAIIVISIAIPATAVLKSQDDYSLADVTVKITGHQWYWEYEYLDDGIRYTSNLSTPPQQIDGSEPKGQWYLREVDRPMVVPVNQKIRFLTTSGDVIHSWWVPELGVKRDALPGFINESWARIEQPGIYRGQCAELCGVNHGFMPIVVEALSAADYQQWLDSQSLPPPQQRQAKDWTMELALARGSALYDRHCAACHKVDGSGLPPLYPPLKDSSIAVSTDINRHVDLVLQGVPNSAMQAFASQLNNEELAAIITYERNAWGHNTGDLLTPADIQARRR
jgi:cytochrome c oxidase subunit 2